MMPGMDFRGIQDADYAQAAELYGEHYLRHFQTSADDLRKAGPVGRYVVVEQGRAQSRVAAYAAAAPVADDLKARRVEIYTGPGEDSDPAWTLLHDEIVKLLKGSGVERIRSVVREDYPAVRRLEAAGYRVGWQSWAAHLHLDGPLAGDAFGDIVDGTAHAVVEVGTAGEAGKISDGSEVGEDLQRREAAYRLYTRTIADFPWTPVTAPAEYDAEAFAKLLAERRAFGAFENGSCLALTVVERESDDDAETMFTVVAAEERGGGLAKLVKAVAIRTLAGEGVRTFGTGGADAGANAASLRMNQALGYVLDPFWRTYELVL
jgi:hypothetical protein